MIAEAAVDVESEGEVASSATVWKITGSARLMGDTPAR